jgi:hypothetical protein
MKVHISGTDSVIDRWFENADPGDWVGVFENNDLGHRDLGTKMGLLYDQSEWDKAVVGKTIGPDTAEFGLGWRYILIAKSESAAGAKCAMRRYDEEDS